MVCLFGGRYNRSSKGSLTQTDSTFLVSIGSLIQTNSTFLVSKGSLIQTNSTFLVSKGSLIQTNSTCLVLCMNRYSNHTSAFSPSMVADTCIWVYTMESVYFHSLKSLFHQVLYKPLLASMVCMVSVGEVPGLGSRHVLYAVNISCLQCILVPPVLVLWWRVFLFTVYRY